MRVLPILLLLGACSADVASPELRTLVEGTVPGVRITGVVRAERGGRTHYDVTGERDGRPVAVDVLAEGNGTLRAVGVEQDISWLGTPAAVKARAGTVAPSRVIARREPDRDATTYTLIMPGRAPIVVRTAGDGR